MRGLLLERDSDVERIGHPLRRVPMALDGGHDEKWLQRLLFDHPELIPLGVIDPGVKDVVVICRELSIPKEGSTVFLDILAVTPHGRLVLIECKLWRNPQARREVIAQILEYASLLRRWSYADLTARLKTTLANTSANPLFDRIRGLRADIEEAAFVDAVSRCLATGDFDLIVAGDGIRSDLQAIAAHLNSFSGLTARLALLEIQLWEDGAGRTVIVPFVPYRTEVIQHRVIVDAGGVPLVIASGADEADIAAAVVDDEQKLQFDRNRSFWQAFIDTVRFDHADQPLPRHGGNNWVKIGFPEPIKWVTAYRNKNEVGLLFRLRNDAGKGLFEQLAEQAGAIKIETGAAPNFLVKTAEPFEGTISIVDTFDPVKRPNDNEMLTWLRTTANRLVSAIRLRLQPALKDGL